MITGHAVVGTAQFFVIFQVRRALVFRPVTYAFRKNAGKKERMVSDVGSNVEAGVVVRRLQEERSQNVETLSWEQARRHALDFALRALGAPRRKGG